MPFREHIMNMQVLEDNFAFLNGLLKNNQQELVHINFNMKLHFSILFYHQICNYRLWNHSYLTYKREIQPPPSHMCNNQQ